MATQALGMEEEVGVCIRRDKILTIAGLERGDDDGNKSDDGHEVKMEGREVNIACDKRNVAMSQKVMWV
jgi:hypothetical protein